MSTTAASLIGFTNSQVGVIIVVVISTAMTTWLNIAVIISCTASSTSRVDSSLIDVVASSACCMLGCAIKVSALATNVTKMSDSECMGLGRTSRH